MSTGLCMLAAGGRYLRIFSADWADICASTRPAASHESEAMMPGPPALVTIATLGPFGTGCVDSVLESSISSSTELALSAEAWVQSALYALSLPASAPVWDEAACAPAWVIPALKNTTGLTLVAFFKTLKNLCPSETPSMYMEMTRVSSSSASASRKSLSTRSPLLPRLITLEKPTASARAQSM